MTALASGVNATQSRVTVDDSTGVTAGFYRIDDEILEFKTNTEWRNPPGNRWIVRRGREGTVAASHTAGASITPWTTALISDDGTPFAVAAEQITADQKAALDAASSPSATNPIATLDDIIRVFTVPLSSDDILHLALTDTPIQVAPAVPGKAWVPIGPLKAAYFPGPVPNSYTWSGHLTIGFNDPFGFQGENPFDQLDLAGITQSEQGVMFGNGTGSLGIGTYESSTASQAWVNLPLLAWVDASNPTGGDGTMRLFTECRLLDMSLPGVPFGLRYLQQPTDVAASAVISPAIRVAIVDNLGNTITTDNSSSMALMIQTGTGSLGGTTTRTVVNGVATFDDITVDTAGAKSLLAESSFFDSISVVFTVS